MVFRLKNLFIVAGLLVSGWISYSTYLYFFDTTKPEVGINGLMNQECYAGDASCTLTSNKAGDVCVWLDGQPLTNKYKMGAHNDQPFVIPTKTIANGQHTLKVEFTDRTYKKNKAVVERQFCVDNIPLQAAFVKADTDYKVFQGRTLHIQFQVNKEIKEAKINTLSNSFDCFPEAKGSLIYEAFVPISCEENPNEYLFNVAIADRVGNQLSLDNKFQVVMYPFKKQNLTISDQKLQEERQQAQITDDEFDTRITKVTNSSPKEKMFKGAFCTPIDIAKVTCEFGTVRTTQHKGRYAHKALDVINRPKSVVWSTQDGVVAVKDRFTAGGNTVVVDHGFGILSMFYHLDDFANIQVGQKIAKGSPVGTIGKTGYATGYHLHWEMRVNNIPVDPMQWTQPIF